MCKLSHKTNPLKVSGFYFENFIFFISSKLTVSLLSRSVEIKKILEGTNLIQFVYNSLKCLTIIEVGNVNFQHQKLFIQNLFRVNPQSLQTFQYTKGWDFMFNFRRLNDES